MWTLSPSHCRATVDEGSLTTPQPKQQTATHRANASCTLYPREKIGNTNQMKEKFLIHISLVRLREMWEDLRLYQAGGRYKT